MKSRFFKNILIFVVIVFTISIMAGCETKQNGETEKTSGVQTQSGTKSAETEAEQEEPAVVKILMMQAYANSEYNSIVWQTLEEKTNVKLDCAW